MNDERLVEILRASALSAEERLVALVAAGEARDSFACVILDPTRPRRQSTPAERAMAAVLLGPSAECYLPFALAKADAHDRHGCCNGLLVAKANFCLGNNDFAWGDSAGCEVEDWETGETIILAPAGGSGLTVDQDREFTAAIVNGTMKTVHQQRAEWLRARREAGTPTAWFNPDTEPGREYIDIYTLPVIAS